METTVKPKKSRSKAAAANSGANSVPQGPDDIQRYRDEAWQLEVELEAELWKDAVLTARMALEELRTDTREYPHERRRGIRLKEKAQKVERAFNRLRALRKGDLIPPRGDDD